MSAARASFVVMVLLVSTVSVQGHADRETELPPGVQQTPEYRTTGPYSVTCKEDTLDRTAGYPFQLKLRIMTLYVECMDRGFEHLQAAVNAVPARGWRILMLPGHYFEEPSVEALTDPTPECAEFVGAPWMEYEDMLVCPNILNTVAILGDRDGDRICGTSPEEVLCDLQIEGLGLEREDVILDADWNHLNALRADRADGIYIKHFTAQRTDFNAVYFIELDGFVIDDHLTRWNYEYGYLTFAVDHGLYIDCESYGNGDSGIYPGSAADRDGSRFSVEITRCDSHHNALGYSGTAGNTVYAHHNKFHHNSAGIATDSLFPDHPGLPQNSARFVENEIYSNNENYFDNWLPGGPCHKPLPERGIENGTVCPVIPLPVGTGILIAGGNANRIVGNHIYDNWRYGAMLFGVPSYFRGEDDPSSMQTYETQFDTSHDNWFIGNFMGLDPNGTEMPNGRDWWWDEGGRGNCWEANTYVAGGERTDPSDPTLVMPECGEFDQLNLWRPPHPRLATIVPCNDYDEPENTHPDGCEWMNDPEAP